MKNTIKWIAGIILVLAGLGTLIGKQPVAAVLYIFAGVICIPPAFDWIVQKTGMKLKTWQKYALVIIPMVIGGATLPTPPSSPATVTASENKTESAASAPVEKKYNVVGDQVRAGDFAYVVDEIAWKKEIGNEYTKSTADGIYLLVSLRVVNGGKETKMLDNSMFKMTGPNDVTYETSTNATTAIEMSGMKSLFLKQCQPGIASAGILAFEVPAKGEYDLHLSSGFWNTNTVAVKLK